VPEYLGLYLSRGSKVLFQEKLWRIDKYDGDHVVIARPDTDPVRIETGSLIHAQPQQHRLELASMMHYTQSFTTYELSATTAKEAAERKAEHVRELQTGYRSGDDHDALPGEPRPEFDPRVVRTIGKRRAAKARQLKVSTRTLQRWEKRYRRGGVVALTHRTQLAPRVSFPGVDPRWTASFRAVVKKALKETTPPTKVLIEAATLNAPDAKPPSRATAYAMFKEFKEGTGLDLISKTRASINARTGKRLPLRTVSYPGEIVQLDTTTLDVFCVDPAGGKPYRPELTVAIDQYTRCILAMVIARKTSAEHVATLMAEVIQPRPLNPDWPGNPAWPYHGVPYSMQYTSHTEDGELIGPAVTPETIVVDNGKVFTGWDMKGIAGLVGFSVEATRPGSGFSKGQVERFFGTMARAALARLLGYTGGHVSSTLGDPAGQAHYTPDEVLEYLRQWVATDYHLTKQQDLFAPGTEFGNHSPFEMYALGMETQGVLRAPVDVDLRYRILPIEPRKVTHGPLRIRNRKYNSPILQEFEGSRSTFPDGKWPIHWDANDRTAVWLEDNDHGFHRIPWTESAKTPAPMTDEVVKVVDALRRESDHREALKVTARADLSQHNRYLEKSPPAPNKPAKRPEQDVVAAAQQFLQVAARYAVDDTQQRIERGVARALPAGLGYGAGFETGGADDGR
jgi:transposase InsO family protein